MSDGSHSIEVGIVAIPETAGSALYGMVDVLLAAGNIWQTLSGQGVPATPFKVSIVSEQRTPFTCGNGIPVRPTPASRTTRQPMS